MNVYIPLVLIIFILGHLGAKSLLEMPTKEYLAHTPRLTAQQFKRHYPDQKWIAKGYPLFTFLWGLLSMIVIILVVVVLVLGMISGHLSEDQFGRFWLSFVALSSIYMNAFFALGTGLFEMKYKVSGTGGWGKAYLGWPAYDRGATIGTQRVPFAYVAGEEVALAGKQRFHLSTSLLLLIFLLLLGIVLF